MPSFLLHLIAFVLFPAGALWALYQQRRSARHVADAKAASDRFGGQIRELDAEKAYLSDELNWQRELINKCAAMTMAFGITDDDLPGCFLYVNDEACSILEYDRDKLLTLSPLDIETIHDPGMPVAQLGYDRMLLGSDEHLARNSSFALRNIRNLVKRVAGGETVTHSTSFITRSGLRVPVLVTGICTNLHGQTVIVYRAQDMTAQQLAERDLKEAELRFKTLFSTAPMGIALYDAQQDLMHINAAALRMFGVPDQQEFARFSLLDNAYLTDRQRAGIRHGETVRAEIRVDFPELIAAGGLVSSRRSTGAFDMLVENLGKDDVQNARGILVQIIDISDLRETEAVLEQREQQLRQARKMEAIGTMAGGIAHDFNNILSPILGYSEIGMDLCPEDHQLHDFMKEIYAASMRAKDLVHQILIFTRQDETANSEIHLVPIVKEVAKQQQTALPKSIEVKSIIRVEQDLVLANPTQIHQVITNLCTNAAYAMKTTGGQLELRLSQFNLAWRHRYEFPELKKGQYIRLSIRDTGSGMDEETRSRIFEPFFSTKPRGEGTGMGLSVVHSIVSSTGGGIAVESKPGEGTTIHVALPLLQSTQEADRQEAVLPPTRNERILFVDDEASITKMAQHMLRSLGYEPTVVSDSTQALERFRRTPEAFDLLITDQVMPGMTGAELIANIRAIRADLPVVVCSGFSEQFTPEAAEKMGIREFLMKPVERQQLAEAVHRALGSPEPRQPQPAAPESPAGAAGDITDDTIIMP